MLCKTAVNRPHFQAWVALRICSLKIALFCHLVTYVLLCGWLVIYLMWWFMIWCLLCVFLVSLSQNYHVKLAVAAAAKPRKTDHVVVLIFNWFVNHRFFERGDWGVTFQICFLLLRAAHIGFVFDLYVCSTRHFSNKKDVGGFYW